MRFDNFTRATCILYIDLVETLNFQLRCLVEKVAHINNRKTVRANSLVTAHSSRVCKCCCYVNFVTFNNAELWILQTGIPACKTD